VRRRHHHHQHRPLDLPYKREENIHQPHRKQGLHICEGYNSNDGDSLYLRNRPSHRRGGEWRTQYHPTARVVCVPRNKPY
jgi:hypothetical protein